MENLEKQILNKIQEMKTLIAAMNDIDNLTVPEKPEPLSIYSISEYQIYQEELINYNKVLHLKSIERNNIEKDLAKNNDEIIKLLPASNTWFRIGSFFVGFETDDWPMSKPSLIIENNESELRTLRHRIIN